VDQGKFRQILMDFFSKNAYQRAFLVLNTFDLFNAVENGVVLKI